VAFKLNVMPSVVLSPNGSSRNDEKTSGPILGVSPASLDRVADTEYLKTKHRLQAEEYDGDDEPESEVDDDEDEDVDSEVDVEDEEEDEVEEDEEPALKYERIGGSVPDLLKKDSASALAISKTTMA